MERETMTIHNFEALKEKMQTMEFWVEWTVYSDIGPNWIGSYRKVEFVLGSYKLANTNFHEEIEKKLVTALKIPKTSQDLVIYGDAEILLENNTLKADYSWYAAAPYDEPEDFGDGETVFYP